MDTIAPSEMFEVTPLGDRALLIRPREPAPDSVPSLATLLDLQRRLVAAAIRGVSEIATGYASVAVFYDPAEATATDQASPFESMRRAILAALGKRSRGKQRRQRAIAIFEIPVCYEEEFAPDLAALASRAHLSPDEVVRRHASAIYQVRCVGFMPGFPYLSGLPAELTMPRRAAPRKEVTGGSVAIGGTHTGIYPQTSPAGWNVIGRTPLRLFDPRRDPPALLQTGCEVCFRSIKRAEFDELAR